MRIGLKGWRKGRIFFQTIIFVTACLFAKNRVGLLPKVGL
jgi:hypothetical protein